MGLLLRRGKARMIAVSLGDEGAILGTANGIFRLPAIAVEERVAVGASDSFLAGLVLGPAGPRVRHGSRRRGRSRLCHCPGESG